MIDDWVLRKYNLTPLGYEKNNNIVIVSTKDKKYVIKKNTSDINKIFKYLNTRSFNYYPYVYNSDNDYSIYEYLDDYDILKEEKANDLINLVSLLHTKTTHYRNVDIDDYKIIYEDIDNKLNELLEYYFSLNDYIDGEIFMSPSNYLLARNISKIYALIDYLKKELNSWYNLIKDSNRQRVALIHNNLELDHMIRNDNSYLISWDKAKFDLPIYDIYNFYKKNYKDVDFSILLEEYEKRYPLSLEEKKLLFILISLPDKIKFTNNDYKNTESVNDLLEYIYKTDKLISPYYSNKQKEEENNF